MNERKYIKQMSIFTDPTRLKIIYVLSMNKFCSMHLEKLLNVSQPNISRHLDKMINADIVASQKNGRRNIYMLTETFVDEHSQIIAQIQGLYPDLIDLDLLADYKEECLKLT